MTTLLNPSFEGGYYHLNDVTELAIPAFWNFWYQRKDALRLERQDNDWFRPECVIWRKQDAPPNEQGLFFLDGDYCLKVFKGWGPTWFKLSQTVTGLVPGARYRFTVNVFPDLVSSYSGSEKQFADDPLAGEHRLYVGSTETEWMDGDKVNFGYYNSLSSNGYASTDGTMTVAIEVRGRWGLLNNGWFFDKFSLVQWDTPAPEPVPTPDPTPEPTPIPPSAEGRRYFFATAVADVTDGGIGQLELLEQFDAAFAEALAKVGIVVRH